MTRGRCYAKKKKIRVRWYNEENNFKKEIKYSSIEGRFKYSEFADNLKSQNEIFKFKYIDKNYGEVIPTLL